MAKAAKEKTGTVSALDYLSQPDKYPPGGVLAIYGDDAYLKSETMRVVRRSMLADDDGEFAVTTFTGKETQLREVLDALSTISLFGGGRRMVIVEEADSFVTEYRSQLEQYVAQPAKGSVLVLEVKSWPGNTKLAKAVAQIGLAIQCRSYDSCEPRERKTHERKIKSWLLERAKTLHRVRLDSAAADALLALVPPEPGVLDQEVARLALLAGENVSIDVPLVRENVGGWRVRAIWDMIDAAADGRAAEALAQLDRLIASGEKPHGLFPQMASSLRAFTSATELVEAAEAQGQRLPISIALKQAGVQPFKLTAAEQQLRRIGRSRAKQITGWLLAVDLAIKGHNSSDAAARIELERLMVRLAAENSQSRVGAVAT